MKNRNKIIFLLGKGGTAKSTSTAAIHWLLVALKINHALLSVEQHGQLLRILCPTAQEIRYREREIEELGTALDSIYHAAINGHVLIDTGANTSRGLVTWLHSTSFLKTAAQANVDVAFVFFGLPDSEDCVDLLNRLYEFAKNNVQWFVAKSPVRGGDFSALEAKAEEIDATLLEIPKVPDRLLNLCIKHRISFTSHSLPTSIDVMEANRLATIRLNFGSAIKPLIDFFHDK